MRYKALDIAKYIINYCINKKEPIDTVKLQLILYYTQAVFLVRLGVPCFDEDFIKWRFGPVQKEVYEEYRGYTGGDIYDIQDKYIEYEHSPHYPHVNIITKSFDENIIEKEDRNIIKNIIDGYSDKTGWDLSNKAKEETPWLNSDKHEIISLESIKDFFCKNPHKIKEFL